MLSIEMIDRRTINNFLHQIFLVSMSLFLKVGNNNKSSQGESSSSFLIIIFIQSQELKIP